MHLGSLQKSISVAHRWHLNNKAVECLQVEDGRLCSYNQAIGYAVLAHAEWLSGTNARARVPPASYLKAAGRSNLSMAGSSDLQAPCNIPRTSDQSP
jgi:hypothetical protein